jgi:predicted nucleic acid-binding protein
MILVDTSVWIDFLRGAGSAEAGCLASLLEEESDICICGLILTEILQGIRESGQHRKVRRSLEPLIYLPTHRSVYVRAADIYRAARARGETIRNSLDCIIASVAIEHGVPLLQRDRDFTLIAAHSRLKLHGAE